MLLSYPGGVSSVYTGGGVPPVVDVLNTERSTICGLKSCNVQFLIFLRSARHERANVFLLCPMLYSRVQKRCDRSCKLKKDEMKAGTQKKEEKMI